MTLLVNLVANGMSTAEILAEYTDLEADDVAQANAYAAALGSFIALEPYAFGANASSALNSCRTSSPCARSASASSDVWMPGHALRHRSARS